MPSHRVHRALEKQIFGRTYEEVHRMKDAAAPVAPGMRHRQWGHDHLSNALIAAQLGDPAAFLAGEYHDMLDKIVSSMPPVARKLIEGMVR